MKQVRTQETTERLYRFIGQAFQDLEYVAGDMPALLRAMQKRGANIRQLMSQCHRECPCTCPKCQRDWLRAILKDHHNDAGKRDILCTGNDKNGLWFYQDGMAYEACRSNGRITREQVIEFLVKVEASMVKMRRKQTIAINAIRETIKQLREGTPFDMPPLLQQGTMFEDDAA